MTTSPSKSARLALSERPHRRILLKISGESMGGSAGQGVGMEEVQKIAQSCQSIHAMGKELAIVVGALLTLELSGSKQFVLRNRQFGRRYSVAKSRL